MLQQDMPLSQELVAFYRTRLDSFEAEREDVATLLQQCSMERGQMYALEQAANKAAAQVQNLQKALSDSQLQLFDARDKVLQLQADRDGLLLDRKQDKARIQSLLAFTQPVLHDVVYETDKRPASTVTYPLSVRRDSGNPKEPAVKETLRTLFLPNEEAQLLVEKLAALQAQLAKQHDFSQERIAALLEDRRQREEACAAQNAASTSKMEDLQGRLDQKCTLLEKTTRELLLCRHQQQVAERHYQEQLAAHSTTALHAQQSSHRTCKQLDLALELLPRQCADAVRAMGAALAQAQAEKHADTGKGAPVARDDDSGNDPGASCREAAVAAAAAHSARVEKRFREQAAALEAELKQARTTLNSVGRQQQQRITQLEEQLHNVKARKRELEYRRALDIEGFANEMVLLKKQLVTTERRVRELAHDSGSTAEDPLTIVEQLAAVRDQLDSVAAKILKHNQDSGQEADSMPVG